MTSTVYLWKLSVYFSWSSRCLRNLYPDLIDICKRTKATKGILIFFQIMCYEWTSIIPIPYSVPQNIAQFHFPQFVSNYLIHNNFTHEHKYVVYARQNRRKSNYISQCLGSKTVLLMKTFYVGKCAMCIGNINTCT